MRILVICFFALILLAEAKAEEVKKNEEYIVPAPQPAPPAVPLPGSSSSTQIAPPAVPLSQPQTPTPKPKPTPSSKPAPATQPSKPREPIFKTRALRVLEGSIENIQEIPEQFETQLTLIDSENQKYTLALTPETKITSKAKPKLKLTAADLKLKDTIEAHCNPTLQNNRYIAEKIKIER